MMKRDQASGGISRNLSIARMNRWVRPGRRLAALGLAAAVASALAQGRIAQATTYYWDANGAATGFGTPNGTDTWGTDANWSIDPTGSSATAASVTTTNDSINFGTETAGYGLGTGTVNVGTVSAGNLTFGAASGNVALSGGTITLADTAAITTNNSANTISSVLTGASVSLTKAGTGMLTLTGHSTYGGATVISGGVLQLSGIDPGVAASLYVDASTLAAGKISSANNLGTGGGSFFVSKDGVTVRTNSQGQLSHVSVAPFSNGRNGFLFNSLSALVSTNAYANAGTQMTIFTVASSAGASANSNYAGYLSFVPSNTDGSLDYASDGLAAVTTDGSGSYFDPTRANNNLPGGNGTPLVPKGPFVTAQAFDTNAGTSTFSLVDSSGDVTNLADTSGLIGSNRFNIAATAIGARFGGPFGNNWTGDVGEVIVFNTALTPAQTTYIQNYLEAKWLGIGIMPSDGNLPTTTTLSIATGASLDLNGASQQIALLMDSSPGTGGHVINSASGVSSTLILSPTGGATATFSGIISGSGGTINLEMNSTDGTGTQVLAGANTFTGTTTLTAGTLQLSNQFALQNSTLIMNGGNVKFDQSVTGHAFTLGGLSGPGNLTLTDNGGHAVALTVGNNNANTNYSGNLSGGSGLTKIGTGTLTLGGVNSYAGPTRIAGGTLRLSGGSAINVNVGPAGYTGTGPSSDSGTSWNLVGQNTTRGGLVNSSGLATGVSVTTSGGDGQYFDGTNPSSLLGGYIYDAGNGNGPETYTFSGLPSGVAYDVYAIANGGYTGRQEQFTIGSNSLTVTTSSDWGVTSVTDPNVFAEFTNQTPVGGQIVITATAVGNSGEGDINGFQLVPVNPGSALPSGTPVTIAPGATLDLDGGIQQIASLADTVAGNNSSNVINSGAGTSSNLILSPSSGGTTTFSGIIGGGSGTINLEMNGNGTQILAGANTFTGTTTVTAGTLQLNNQDALQNSTLIMNGGNLAFDQGVSGHAFTLGGISGSGNLALNDNNANAVALTVGNNNASTSYSGALSGNNSSLTKIGAGTLSLSNGGSQNSYTGGTFINGGTLLLVGTNVLPSAGIVQVNAGGTLSLADGAAATTTVPQLGLASGANLAFDWSGSTTDTLVSSAAATTAGVVGIRINADPNNTPTGTGTILSSAHGGLQTAGNTQYYLANNTNFTATLTATDTVVSIGNYSTVAAPGSFYWQGNHVAGASTAGVDNAWALSNGTASNWTDSNGNITPVVPGPTSNVVFSNAGASQQTTVLGADMTVNSVTINDSTPITIGGSNYLTLMSTGTGANSAICVNSGASNPIISSNVVLGASQTWYLAIGKTLNVSGNVSGVSALTVDGGGTLVLSGANSYSGPTTISNGTLLVNGSVAGGRVTVGSASTLGGHGTISDAVIVNGTVSPGVAGSPSTLTTGSQSWNGGGTYVVNTTLPRGNGIANTGSAGNPNFTSTSITASSVPGTGTQDFLLVSSGGTIRINATSTSPFIINLNNSSTPMDGNAAFIVAAASGIVDPDITGSNNPILTATDITADFIVQENGVALTAGDYNVSVQPDAVAGTYDIVVTPEPGSLGLLGMASLGLLRRRRVNRHSDGII